jgi:hypothetical protein
VITYDPSSNVFEVYNLSATYIIASLLISNNILTMVGNADSGARSYTVSFSLDKPLNDHPQLTLNTVDTVVTVAGSSNIDIVAYAMSAVTASTYTLTSNPSGLVLNSTTSVQVYLDVQAKTDTVYINDLQENQQHIIDFQLTCSESGLTPITYAIVANGGNPMFEHGIEPSVRPGR